MRFSVTIGGLSRLSNDNLPQDKLSYRYRCAAALYSPYRSAFPLAAPSLGVQ